MAVNDVSPNHSVHDELLIAAFAAGDLQGSEETTAAELVASCRTCARLADDLAVIRLAVASLPAVRRRRDFTLSAADAARLRPRSWRRFLVPLAGPRLAFMQPMAAGLATIGLAGLLFATIPALSGAGIGSGGASVETSTDRNAAPVQPVPSDGSEAGESPPNLALPAPSSSPAVGAAAESPAPEAPSAEPAPGGAVGPSETTPEAEKDLTFGTSEAPAASDWRQLLVGVSLVLTLVGVGLFVLRWSAHRLAA